MIEISIAWYVILMIFGVIGMLVVFVGILGVLLVIFTSKEEYENNENCPDFIEKEWDYEKKNY